MNTEKQSFESDRQIAIMGAVSIVFSLLTGSPSIGMLFIISVVPLVCAVLFIVTKHPAFGILCTAAFFLNRISTFTKGTLLSTAVILAITAYFVYVDYLGIRDWRLRKESKNQK